MKQHKTNKDLKNTSSWNVDLPPSPCLVSMYCSTLTTSGLVSCLSVPVSHLDSLKILVSDPIFTDLSKKINATHLNPDMLVGKYVPNSSPNPSKSLMSMPRLSTTKLLCLASTKSSTNGKKINGPALKTANSHTSFLFLAYQFASPICWIETQDLLLTSFNFKCLAKLSPSPTLTGIGHMYPESQI